MSEKTFTWDWREQPPLGEIAAAVAELSGGAVRVAIPDTGSDEYALTVLQSVESRPAPGLTAQSASQRRRMDAQAAPELGAAVAAVSDTRTYGEIFQRAHGGDSWANLGPAGQACVQAGAEAVAMDVMRRLHPAAPELAAAMAESRQLREQLDDLRTSLDYAAGQWESNAMRHTMPVRDAAERGIYAGCARDLRAALKANAPDAADVRAERDELRDQLAAADRATAEFRRQCSELAGELGAARAVVREMDAHIASGDDYADPAKRAGWLQRAGIGAGQ